MFSAHTYWGQGSCHTQPDPGHMSTNYLFTVFTCTYNRAHTLHRVRESLQMQTFRNFEWLIFDNGSKDHTADLVARWARETSFPIRYLSWRDNTGYQNAINEGVAAARGELFVMLDSDDRCLPQALERFHALWHEIPEQKRERFAGVTVLCEDQYGNLAGTPFPRDRMESDALELEYRYKVKGEKWGFVRTDILREHPFPSVEHHVMPHVVWHRIARRYRTLFANEVLRIYYQDDTGDAAQLTAVPPGHNALGKLLGHQAILDNNMDWFATAPIALCRAAVQYIRYSRHAGRGAMQQARELRGRAGRALCWALQPAGLLLYLLDLGRHSRRAIAAGREGVDYHSLPGDP